MLSGSICSLLLSLTCTDLSAACLCHCLMDGDPPMHIDLLLRGVAGLQMGEKDLQEEDTKQYVANLLNQQIEHPDFQLSPDQVHTASSSPVPAAAHATFDVTVMDVRQDVGSTLHMAFIKKPAVTNSFVLSRIAIQVLLVSAKDGLMARLQLQGQATKAETDDFIRSAFGRTSKVLRCCFMAASLHAMLISFPACELAAMPAVPWCLHMSLDMCCQPWLISSHVCSALVTTYLWLPLSQHRHRACRTMYQCSSCSSSGPRVAAQSTQEDCWPGTCSDTAAAGRPGQSLGRRL